MITDGKVDNVSETLLSINKLNNLEQKISIFTVNHSFKSLAVNNDGFYNPIKASNQSSITLRFYQIQY